VRDDPDYLKLLFRSGAEFPPILVDRSTMEVVDGHHRLAVARMRNRELIAVRFFDGDRDQAIVLSIRANVTHGKALSLREREQAAVEVLQRMPEFSDRFVSECCGLAPGTVRTLRERATDQNGQLSHRVGRDGRARPSNPAQARRDIAEYLIEHPTASLREVATSVGAAANTVRKVRRLLGDAPLTNRERATDSEDTPDRRVTESAEGDNNCRRP